MHTACIRTLTILFYFKLIKQTTMKISKEKRNCQAQAITNIPFYLEHQLSDLTHNCRSKQLNRMDKN